MKEIVSVTPMLWYEGIGMSAQTDFTRVEFKTITECQDYVFKNKVMLIDELFDAHKVVDDKVFGQVNLRSFEFFCETKYIEEEIKEEEDKFMMEL